MHETEVRRVYVKVSNARVPDALLVDALELVSHTPRMVNDRQELVARLCDEEHMRVLRKEVIDVVMLVTGALEAPSVEVFEAFVGYADAQIPLTEPFDELTALLRVEIGIKLAVDALDEAGDGPERERVVANLQAALAVLGETRPVTDLAQIWED